MLGAIIGDIVGSPYEFTSDKTKDFRFLAPYCTPTDDSIMTIAVGCACVEADCDDEEEFKKILTQKMRELGRQYPDAGYGIGFYNWLTEDDEGPYGSFGNGSAMRVSPVAWAADTLEDAERLAKWSEGDGEVWIIDTMDGRTIQIGKSEYEISSGKEKAEWDDFFQRTCNLDYAQIDRYDNYGNPVYTLTKKGYDYIGQLSSL